jgi:amino acid transporter
MSAPSPAAGAPRLERALGLPQATSLNVANMIGIGPFITIPAFIATMEGPQAMVGWIAAAVLVICDGLVWSELGAAMPGSGGTYHYLREIYGRRPWGRAIPFLFIWQFLFSGTLELASGYIGLIGYLKYVFPGLGSWEQTYRFALFPDAPPAWTLEVSSLGVLGALLSVAVTLLLCRRIRQVGALSVVLCSGTLATVLVVIAAGLLNFDASLIEFPPGAFHLDGKFSTGLGAAMLIAIYDYLGYYNVCHLGEEVRDPGRTIPRAVIISTILVAAIYLTMNLSIIGVVPWREAMQSQNVAALFMERLYGAGVASAFTWAIVWTALACVFVMTLGYSRIVYAAAREGDFFRPFAVLHPSGGYPRLALWIVGGMTGLFCFFKLEAVITAAVTLRIAIQFIGQIVGLHLLRQRRPEVERPFKMWLYPLPSLIALCGWCFVLWKAEWPFILAAVLVLLSGLLAYVLWRRVSGHPGAATAAPSASRAGDGGSAAPGSS